MKLNQSEKFNSEYCARIVRINSFEQHPNPKCTKMKCALVGAYSISVSLDTEPGYFIYFPVGSQINGKFLAANNLFRKAQMNDDPTKTGFFEETCKVKPIKLQGYPSEGFLMPYESLKSWINEELPEPVANYEFDSVNDSILVKRYFVPIKKVGSSKPRGKDASKHFSKLVDGQFRFHYSTDSLEKMPWVIKPWNLIHASTKSHGSSGVSAYVLCKENPSIRAKIGNWITRHIIDPIAGLRTAPLSESRYYDYIYSSRKVVKNDCTGSGYYGSDEFRKIADDVLRPHLVKGMTLYYELVGFTTTGSPIQALRGYPMDYGCVQPQEGETYEYNKHFKILIYRITLTNPDGYVHEYSAHEVQLWCKQEGLTPVKELYWGFAKDLYPELDIYSEDWSKQFVKKLKEDQEHFYMEMDSPDCQNPVPHEGIVIRIDDGKQAAYKVKCFKFLDREDKDYDEGVVNIEDQELEA